MVRVRVKVRVRVRVKVKVKVRVRVRVCDLNDQIRSSPPRVSDSNLSLDLS